MIKAVRYADAQALKAAFAGLLRETFSSGGTDPFAVMLSGGSTPMAAYAQLAGSPPRVAPGLRLLFSDDRHVPPTHEKSNYFQTKPMIDALGLGPDRVLRVEGEQPLDEATERFGRGMAAWIDEGVSFPIGFLGLGADGHTASLFTPAHIDAAKGRFALGVDRPDGLRGVSLTPDALLRVQRIVFLVAGADKREMTRRLLRDTRSIAAGLATLSHPHVELWADAAAWPFDEATGR